MNEANRSSLLIASSLLTLSLFACGRPQQEGAAPASVTPSATAALAPTAATPSANPVVSAAPPSSAAPAPTAAAPSVRASLDGKAWDQTGGVSFSDRSFAGRGLKVDRMRDQAMMMFELPNRAGPFDGKAGASVLYVEGKTSWISVGSKTTGTVRKWEKDGDRYRVSFDIDTVLANANDAKKTQRLEAHVEDAFVLPGAIGRSDAPPVDLHK